MNQFANPLADSFVGRPSIQGFSRAIPILNTVSQIVNDDCLGNAVQEIRARAQVLLPPFVGGDVAAPHRDTVDHRNDLVPNPSRCLSTPWNGHLFLHRRAGFDSANVMSDEMVAAISGHQFTQQLISKIAAR